ncbi:MAG: diguanylate cyclase [Acholeplasmatales bacterium]|nr:diguanylate cyclase [Acholeplasmatales bacterium]
MKEKLKAKGLRSIVIFIPTIVTISILYALILVSTIMINIDTTEMTAANEEVTNCIDLINNLQGGSSKLSATAISFTHTPYYPSPAKPINENALNSYMSEFTDDSKNPNNILDGLKKYGWDENNPTALFNAESAKLIKSSVDAAIEMVRMQSHALRLINTMSIVDLPETVLNSIPEFDLLDEELSLSDDEKQNHALEILLNRDYSEKQQTISENTRAVTKIITSSTLEKNNAISLRIKMFRGFLWGGILLILIANVLLFFILLKRLVFPITNFSKRIDNNERLDEAHALYEPNYLAKAYNRLLDRHKEFETELRNVAEIDSLTNMPNRYCYNEFLKITPEEENNACVFLFDINNLKYVNDTYGHSKGDELIKNASTCIKECFLDQNGRNCFRIGGDEFVAILENINKDDIDDYIQAFQEKQKELNVSIAVGYAFTENIKEVGYEKLIIRADKKMYKNKKQIKEGESPTVVC